MLLPFFYTLRALKIPVGTFEWLTLMQALVLNLNQSSLDFFYLLARSILIKSEAYFDAYDQAFLWCFKEKKGELDIRREIFDWLNQRRDISFRPSMPTIDPFTLEELRRQFHERLKEQIEEHHGGSHWIGTGGTSPFGHSGAHPSGIRIGGPGGGRSAVKIAEERRFANYRNDRVLDTRQFKVALKRLRRLTHEGAPLELNLDKTIQQTCKNAGDIDLVFQAPKKNQTELILLMDVGGTMDPYAELVESLFSAAHALTHFKDFRHYYFHNCVYSKVFSDISRLESIPTAELFKKFRNSYRLVVVGDACMHPYELFSPGGAIHYWEHEPHAGIEWLRMMKEHFHKTIWLNPEPEKFWDHPTISAIKRLLPMFPLTVEGLSTAVDYLRREG